MEAMNNSDMVTKEIVSEVMGYVTTGVSDKYTDEQKNKIVSEVVSKFIFAKSQMSSLRDKWEDIKDAFNAEMAYTVPAGVKEPESRVHSPVFTTYIERLVSMNCIRLIQAYSNFITLRDLVTKTRAYTVENYLFNMYIKHKMALEIVKAVQSAAAFGVGFTKVMPIPTNSSYKPECLVQHVNNFDIFADPNAIKIEDATFIIHRTWISHEELLRRMADGTYDKKECERLLREMSVRANNEDKKSVPISSLLANELSREDMRECEPSSGKFDRYEIYEYFDNSKIVTIAEEKYFLRSVDNVIGYPFQMWYLRVPLTGEMWVKSHGELLLDIQKEIDIKRNQRIENINKINNPTLLYKRASIDPERLMLNSSGKCQVNDLDGFAFIAPPDVTGLNIEEVQILKQEAGEYTGVQPVIMGQSAKKERMNIQETSSIYQMANLQFDFTSTMMVITGLIPMLRTILNICGVLYSDYVQMPQAISSSTGTGALVPIMPIDFLREYEISVDINPTKAEKDYQNAMRLYQLYAQNPYIDQVILLQYVTPKIDPNYPEGLIKELPAGQLMPENVQLSKNG